MTEAFDTDALRRLIRDLYDRSSVEVFHKVDRNALDAAADEIDRLREAHEHLVFHAAGLKIEIDRLTAEYEREQIARSTLKAEKERLRAGIEAAAESLRLKAQVVDIENLLLSLLAEEQDDLDRFVIEESRDPAFASAYAEARRKRMEPMAEEPTP
jgi:hypothetical protein